MYWFVTTIIIIFSFDNLSEAKLERNLPSAVIVGTVYCDTCFQAKLSKPTHFIAGALVGIECKGAKPNPSFQKQVKTNGNGEFRVRLPFSISKNVNKIENCSVKLIKSNEPYCAIASSATQSSLHLKTKNTKTHIFSAGYFTFKPQDQPSLCNQKPSKNFKSRKFLPIIDRSPIVQIPIASNLPMTGQNPNIPNIPLTDQNPNIPNLPMTGRNPNIPNLPPQNPIIPNLPLQNPNIPNLPMTGQNPNIPNIPLTDQNPNIPNLPTQNPNIPNLPPMGPSLLPPLPTLPRLPPLPLLPALPLLPGLPLFPPSEQNSLQPKIKNSLEKRENFPNYEVGKDQVLPPNPQLPTFLSPPPVFGFQFPPFSFRQPPMNFPTNPFQPAPPLGNFPTIPNLNSPPIVPSPPVLTNPLPPFPFQPSPGFPTFPPPAKKSP